MCRRSRVAQLAPGAAESVDGFALFDRVVFAVPDRIDAEEIGVVGASDERIEFRPDTGTPGSRRFESAKTLIEKRFNLDGSHSR